MESNENQETPPPIPPREPATAYTPAPIPPQAQAAIDEQHLGYLVTGHYVTAGLLFLWGCAPSLHVGVGLMLTLNPEAMGTSSSGEPTPTFVGPLFLAMGLVFMLGAWVLAGCILASARMLKASRGYVFILVSNALAGMLLMPIGTALAIFTYLVLLRPSVKARFDQAAT